MTEYPANWVRPMTDAERLLFRRLLEVDFPGREELSKQLEKALVRQIDSDGGLEIHVNDQAPAASVLGRIPVEAEAPDKDGISVRALLHVVGGIAKELEIYKDDGTAIGRHPEPSDWTITAL